MENLRAKAREEALEAAKQLEEVYHEWYLCQISRTNHAIICLYYYPQKVCNFHM